MCSSQGFYWRKEGFSGKWREGGDGEEKAIEILWRKGKRKTQLTHRVSGQNKTCLSKAARAAAKVLKARGGLSQDLGRERGASGAREYFLLNWRHSKPCNADAHETS